MIVVPCIHEFEAKEERVSALHETTRKHGLYTEFAPRNGRIDLAALVAKDRATRLYGHVGKFRETVD